MAQRARTVFDTDNILVINLPVNTKGTLVESDVENLNKVSELLGMRRNWKE